LTQGISVLTGLQEHFSWRDVAIAAVSAPLASTASGLAGAALKGFGPGIATFGSRFVAGATSSIVRGAFHGRVDTDTVLADAFSNAIGNAIVDALTPTEIGPTPQQWADAYRQLDAAVSTPPLELTTQLAVDMDLINVTNNPTSIADMPMPTAEFAPPTDLLREVVVTAERLPDARRRVRSEDMQPDTLKSPPLYELDSSFEDNDRVFFKNGRRNEKGLYAKNPLTTRQSTTDFRSTIELYTFGDPAEQTTVPFPLIGDGVWLNITTTTQNGGTVEFNKDGFAFDYTGKYVKEIRYGDSLVLPNYIDGLTGRVDARAVLEGTASGIAELGWKGAALGGSLKAEAALVQVPFELSYEREFELFTLEVSVTGAGNLGGIGGAIGGGGALTPRGGRFYMEGGLTPGIGARARLTGSIQLTPKAIEYLRAPGEWVGQQLYDATH